MTYQDLMLEDVVSENFDQLGMKVRGGVDRVELVEFERQLLAGRERFLETVYTPDEIAFCEGRTDRLAGRFAAKEATTKVFGTGLRGVSLSEVEVVTLTTGQPVLRLHGRAQALSDALHIRSLSVSLSHTSQAAEAFVVSLTCSDIAYPSIPEERCCDQS